MSVVYLDELSSLRSTFGPDAAARKLELLEKLTPARFSKAADVFRFHEQLCFMQAYPDSREILTACESMLDEFATRPDLRRFASRLVNDGIAGTQTCFHFYWLTAQWLVRHWPERLSIDWAELEDDEPLTEALAVLRTYSDSAAMVEMQLGAREWIERMKGPDETDAAFLVRRIQSLPGVDAQRQHLFESLHLPMRLAPGRRPSRTLAKWTGARPAYQTEAWDDRRPDLREAILAEPVRVRSVSRKLAVALIDQAREAMIGRKRDLDAITWADPNDVQLVEWPDGLQFSWLGLRPQYRPMFEGLYVYVTLKNGVPIGYVQAAALFRSAFINYNVFPPWRGGEAAAIYGRALATARHMLGIDTFAIDVYQLGGDGNEEALQTGAWWFYYKLGFRPRDPHVKRVVRDELRRLRTRPRHRSSRKTLEELASDELFFELGGVRDDIVGRIDFGAVGLRVMNQLASRGGSSREAALGECEEEARHRLGLAEGRISALDRNERIAWERWSPLVVALPGIERWSRAEKRALFDVVCAKGARREAEFVRRFDEHRKLRRSFLQLAQRE